MNGRSDIDVDDLRPKYMDLDQRWNDWYFAVNYTYEEREYFLNLAILEGTFMGRSANRFKLTGGPLIIQPENDLQVLMKPPPEVDLTIIQKENNFNHVEENEEVIINQDELKASCKVNEQKIISKNKNISGELTFKPRSPVFRWGNKKDAKCIVTEGTQIGGIESLSEVQGKLLINGREIEINGRGLFEHVWIEALKIMKIRMQDWIFANFDAMTTFFCHVESNNNDGTPFHYETGALYLIDEDDYLIMKKIECIPKNWIYSKEALRFIPLNQKIRIKTDKGTLKLQTTLSMHPQFIGRPRRIEDLTIHNISGWNFMFYDAPMTLEGKFFYKKGQTVKLTAGKGVNEQLRIFPLY